jgi:ATP-dependent RNA helicase DDX35
MDIPAAVDGGQQRGSSEGRMHGGTASNPPASLGASALAKDTALLPAARHRRQLLWLVERHATVIVIGDTGSGKTTQIPQFLHEAGGYC